MVKKSLLGSTIVIGFVFLVSFSTQEAYAIDYVIDVAAGGYCSSIGSWVDKTCTLNSDIVFGPGDTLLIENGVTVTISKNITIYGSTNEFEDKTIITNNGEINIQDHVLTNKVIIDNNNQVTIGTAILNFGDITNGGTITITGESTINSGALVNHDGTLTNGGTITIDGGEGYNSGRLNNYSGTVNNNGGIIIITGGGNNSGKLENDSGVINNDGIITITGGGGYSSGRLYTNGGTIHNNNGGIITITGGEGYYSGNLDNNGGTVNNNGGTITIAGGGGNGSGRLSNYDGGTVNNNIGTINNESGGMGNIKSIFNNFGGEIINNGEIINHNNAYPDFFDLSTFNNNAGTIGIITNNGDIYNEGNAVFNNFCGSIIDGPNLISGSGAINHPCNDNDRDGISDAIDLQPTTFSSNFSDKNFGGTTFGEITNQGVHDQELSIQDELNNGVRIITGPNGGNLPAQISICNNAAEAFLSDRNEVKGTCSSVKCFDVTFFPRKICFIDQPLKAASPGLIKFCHYFNCQNIKSDCQNCDKIVLDYEDQRKIQSQFPPLKQFKAKISVNEILPKEGNVLVTSDGRDYPVSVTPETAEKLVSLKDSSWKYFRSK